MAKKEETAATATGEKAKRTIVKRSNDDLKKSANGKLIVVVRAAQALANQNKQADLKLTVKEGKDAAKALSGKLNPVLKTGGRIDSLKEKDENYVKLLAAAKKALPELQKSEYGANVKALLNFVIENLAKGEGRKGFNPSILDGITL